MNVDPHLWLVAPVLAPLIAAIVGLLLRGRAATVAAATGHVLHLVVAAGLLTTVIGDGALAVRIGGWSAPFGIALVADTLAALLVGVTALVGGAVGITSLLSPERPHPLRAPLTHVLLTGVCGAFLTGDLFNLYVWFEVLLVSSFVLLTLGRERQAIAGGVRYVAINLVASALFLTALGLLYAKAGTLDMAHLARLVDSDQAGALGGVAALLTVAFGIKAGLFPLFGWLPPAYPAPPPVVAALFAGLLTKVGVYALVRLYTLIFVHDPLAFDLLLILGAATMTVGVLGAAAQGGIRRILSFHIVSQIGYIVVGVALYTPLALGAAVFYLVHHIVVKTGLFLVGGLIGEASGTERLDRLGGLRVAWPLAALMFAIPALSLAGLPPLSGFFAKLGIIRAGIEAGAVAVAVLALAVGLLTLFSMLKIAHAAILQPAPDDRPPRPVGRSRLWPVAVLAAVTLILGLSAGPVFELCLSAGEALMGRTEYLEAAR